MDVKQFQTIGLPPEILGKILVESAQLARGDFTLTPLLQMSDSRGSWTCNQSAGHEEFVVIFEPNLSRIDEWRAEVARLDSERLDLVPMSNLRPKLDDNKKEKLRVRKLALDAQAKIVFLQEKIFTLTETIREASALVEIRLPATIFRELKGELLTVRVNEKSRWTTGTKVVTDLMNIDDEFVPPVHPELEDEDDESTPETNDETKQQGQAPDEGTQATETKPTETEPAENAEETTQDLTDEVDEDEAELESESDEPAQGSLIDDQPEESTENAENA